MWLKIFFNRWKSIKNGKNKLVNYIFFFFFFFSSLPFYIGCYFIASCKDSPLAFCSLVS